MGWSGGVFTRSNGVYSGATVWAQDEAASVDIEAARHDTHDQELATGIDACLTKDGSNSPSSHLSFLNTALWGGTASGSSNNFIVSAAPASGMTLYAGLTIRFKANQTITGAATINLNSLGAKSLKRFDGSATKKGSIKNGQLIEAVYDGTDFLIVSADPVWIDFSPSLTLSGAGSLAVATNTGRYTHDTITCHFTAAITFNLSGTNSSSAIYLATPVNIASEVLGETRIAEATFTDGTNWYPGFGGNRDGSNHRVRIRQDSNLSSSFPTSATAALYIKGTFEKEP